MNTQNIGSAVAELKNALIERFGDRISVIMFGSAARGTCDSESDIDVLVLIPGEVTTRLEEDVFDIAYPIELSRNVIFGIIVYSNEFWNSGPAAAMPLHKNISREGISA